MTDDQKRIELANLKKAPSGASFTYGPITITAEDLAGALGLLSAELQRSLIYHGIAMLDPGPPRVDPLDVKYDGVTLREVATAYEMLQREHHLVQRNARGDIVRYGESMPAWFMRNGAFTPVQRAAVAAHWSAELRAKVTASDERDRNQVLVDLQDEP
jgi:hypothetical protein